MKMTTLSKIKDALETMEPQVRVEDSIRHAAYTTLEKMLVVANL